MFEDIVLNTYLRTVRLELNYMEHITFRIGNIPALLFGAESDKVFLFIHGMNGNKEEAELFANVAVPKGYQVLGVDLPVMAKPGEVLPLLNMVKEYLFANWKTVSVRSNSIGCWFTMLAFQQTRLEKALFVSPILDMKKFIDDMPSREEDYYTWVLNHPVTAWSSPTYVLKPEVDLVVRDDVGREFLEAHNCTVTVMKEGEHWFHTPSQLLFQEKWEKSILSQNEV